uniref:NADH dehydrogenase subunit 6 n=1 Tax=Gmelinoides fasciatus TaxID=686704 RepID=A0A1L5BW59_9CRUS|nr:NADH dehydrogenase subunit 6 [Gmelinoides fasciatus]APL97193.1 NADH dehydrogenase subunit 6 [Gmelinoides fasciatus]
MTLMSSALSLMLIFSKTPLMVTLVILTQATLISISIYLNLLTSWLAYILLLIFVSAMMVVYAYVSSLASNQYIYFTTPPIIPLMFILLSVLIMVPMKKIGLTSSAYLLMNSNLNMGQMPYSKIYSFYTLAAVMFLILYLLMALVAVAKIISNYDGPLRTSHP